MNKARKSVSSMKTICHSVSNESPSLRFFFNNHPTINLGQSLRGSDPAREREDGGLFGARDNDLFLGGGGALVIRM